jgi:hypothetical protein
MEKGEDTHYAFSYNMERSGNLRLLREKEKNCTNLGKKRDTLCFSNCSHLFLSGLKNVVCFTAVPASQFS